MHYSHVTSYFVLALLTLTTSVDADATQGLEARRHGNSSKDCAPKMGAVASESAVCSHIGTRLLEQGGNAADAVRAYHKFNVDCERLILSEAGRYAFLRRCNR